MKSNKGPLPMDKYILGRSQGIFDKDNNLIFNPYQMLAMRLTLEQEFAWMYGYYESYYEE